MHLVESGAVFAVLGLLFLLGSAFSDRPGVFLGLGAMWLVLAVAVRGPSSAEPSGTASRDEDVPED